MATGGFAEIFEKYYTLDKLDAWAISTDTTTNVFTLQHQQQALQALLEKTLFAQSSSLKAVLTSHDADGFTADIVPDTRVTLEEFLGDLWT